jgi:periplasmic divalent cation tolerance protein
MPSTLLVLCTCPDRATALDLADALVEGGLAACVTLQAPVTSIYRWQDRVERAEECLLLIKTGAARYQDLEEAIRARHPYEAPEIIALPVERGFAGYLSWVETCTSAAT